MAQGTHRQAKSQGLWTIVGMHKNCLTIGQKSCEIGADLLNELVAAKVDLVLQGHDHGYQRSKQIGLGADCPAVKTRAYNPACVVDDGSDGSYVRGAGLVFAISATFGRSAYTVDTADPEVGYMAAWMDPAASSNGFLEFTVAKEKIDGRFVTARGTFSDQFTIAAADVPPTPAVTPTPGGTVPPGGAVTSALPRPPPDGRGDAERGICRHGQLLHLEPDASSERSRQGVWLQIDDDCAQRVAVASAGGAAPPGNWEWVNYQDNEPGSPLQARLSGRARGAAVRQRCRRQGGQAYLHDRSQPAAAAAALGHTRAGVSAAGGLIGQE